jgi:hypothetical protein
MGKEMRFVSMIGRVLKELTHAWYPEAPPVFFEAAGIPMQTAVQRSCVGGKGRWCL